MILSEDLWRGYFGGDPQVIGTSIDLDKKSFTVVGIMPSAFRFPSLTKPQQLWIPLAQDPLFGGWLDQRKGHWLQVTGRLKPGVTMAQAQAKLDAIDARLAADFPAENGGWEIRMVPLKQMILGDAKVATARPARRRRAGAAHRVREHRQPASHPRDVPRTGDGGSDHARGGTGQDCPSAAQ